MRSCLDVYGQKKHHQVWPFFRTVSLQSKTASNTIEESWGYYCCDDEGSLWGTTEHLWKNAEVGLWLIDLEEDRGSLSFACCQKQGKCYLRGRQTGESCTWLKPFSFVEKGNVFYVWGGSDPHTLK